MSERKLDDRSLYVRWVRATLLGWMLGIPLIVVVALLGEAVGIGGAQVLVGIGMGAGIGIMQGRALRGVLYRAAPWFWSCVVGLGVPFLAVDVAKVAGLDSVYFVHLSIVAAGLLIGAWQASILGRRFAGARWWVLGSVVGWSLASGMVVIADTLSRSHSLRGVWGALAYLGLIAGGGLFLGIVTGISLVRVRRHDSAS